VISGVCTVASGVSSEVEGTLTGDTVTGGAPTVTATEGTVTGGTLTGATVTGGAPTVWEFPGRIVTVTEGTLRRGTLTGDTVTDGTDGVVTTGIVPVTAMGVDKAGAVAWCAVTGVAGMTQPAPGVGVTAELARTGTGGDNGLACPVGRQAEA
jgi:hypothetical protein